MLDKNHPLYIEDLKYIIHSNDVEILRGKSFLITGATGMVGLCLVDVLMFLNKRGWGINIYALGRSKEKAQERLGVYYSDVHFYFIEQDVRQPLPSFIRVDYIIPLASNTHPIAYSQYPVETIEINVRGIEYALQKAIECGATVLYPSTVEVYGNARGEDIFTEDYTGILNLSTPRSCYTESKRVSEALCLSYIAEKGAEVKIVRLSRLFGPTMLMNDSKASSQFILKALKGEDIVLKSKGEQYYSYTYVADAISAILTVLIKGKNGVAYNVSNQTCNVRLRDLAHFCAKWAGKKIVYDFPSENERNGFSVAMRAILDNTKLVNLGWKGYYDISKGILRTLDILSEKE